MEPITLERSQYIKGFKCPWSYRHIVSECQNRRVITIRGEKERSKTKVRKSRRARGEICGAVLLPNSSDEAMCSELSRLTGRAPAINNETVDGVRVVMYPRCNNDILHLHSCSARKQPGRAKSRKHSSLSDH